VADFDALDLDQLSDVFDMGGYQSNLLHLQQHPLDKVADMTVAQLLSLLGPLLGPTMIPSCKPASDDCRPGGFTKPDNVEGWDVHQWRQWGKMKSKVASSIAHERGKLKACVVELEKEIAVLKAKLNSQSRGGRDDPLAGSDPWASKCLPPRLDSFRFDPRFDPWAGWGATLAEDQNEDEGAREPCPCKGQGFETLPSDKATHLPLFQCPERAWAAMESEKDVEDDNDGYASKNCSIDELDRLVSVAGGNDRNVIGKDEKEVLAQVVTGAEMIKVGDEVVYNGCNDAVVTIVGDNDMQGCSRIKMEERGDLWVATTSLEVKVAAMDG